MPQEPHKIALAAACAGFAMLMTVPDTPLAQTAHQSVTGRLERLVAHPMRCGPGSGWYDVFVKTADGATVKLQLPLRAIGVQEFNRLLNAEITVRFDAYKNISTLHHSGTAVVDYEGPGAIRPSVCSGAGRG